MYDMSAKVRAHLYISFNIVVKAETIMIKLVRWSCNATRGRVPEEIINLIVIFLIASAPTLKYGGATGVTYTCVRSLG